MVDGIAPVRRIVVGESAPGVTTIFSDAPSPDVRGDPARPGFGMTRLWVTEGTPAPVKGRTGRSRLSTWPHSMPAARWRRSPMTATGPRARLDMLEPLHSGDG